MSTETKTTLYEHIKHLHTPRDVNANAVGKSAKLNFPQERDENG